MSVHVSLFGVYGIVFKTLLFDVIHIYMANLLADVGVFVMKHTHIVESTKPARHINIPPVLAALPVYL